MMQTAAASVVSATFMVLWSMRLSSGFLHLPCNSSDPKRVRHAAVYSPLGNDMMGNHAGDDTPRPCLGNDSRLGKSRKSSWANG